MSLHPDDRLTCPTEVLSRVLDGEAVLLHLGTNSYFGMNAVATRAFELVREGITVGALRAALLGEFEVGESELVRDLDELLGDMIRAKLVTVTTASR